MNEHDRMNELQAQICVAAFVMALMAFAFVYITAKMNRELGEDDARIRGQHERIEQIEHDAAPCRCKP